MRAASRRSPWRHRREVRRDRRALELVLVVVAASVLVWQLAERVPPLLAEAERVSVLTTIGRLRSALGTAVARRVVDGDSASLARLAGSNPMRLLPAIPHSYAGEVPADGKLEPGRWYYDPASGWLRYRVSHADRFQVRGGPSDQIQLRVALVYEDRDADGDFDAGREKLYRVELEERHSWRWLPAANDGNKGAGP